MATARCLFTALALVAGTALAQPAVPADAQRVPGTPELMQALAQGGYVIYFRHGHTHWQQKLIEQGMQAERRHDLDNCATQRNLDALGRDDARRIHAALQAARIPVGKVLASLYCRPAEYVSLITGRTPVRTRWLTGLSTPETLVEIKREVATRPVPGTNTVLGGHGDRPFDLTGLVIQEGDALVFDPRSHRADDAGKFKPVAWIKPVEWLALSGAAEPVRDAAPRVAQVNVRATPFHDAGNVRAALPLLTGGAVIEDDALARTLQLARENPARNVEVLLTPSATPGQVDAGVAVASVKPWNVTAGWSHVGSDPGVRGEARHRVFLGASHHNLWNFDHQAVLQVSDASGSQRRNASAAYRLPWPARGVTFGLVGTRSQDGAGLDADLVPITGSGRSWTLSARQHLAPLADYHHHVELDVSDRAWFGAGAPHVRSRPLTLGYAAHWEQEWIGWKFDARWALNLPGGAGNDAAQYALATGNAATGRNWNALRLNAEWMRILTYDIRLRISGRAQASNQALVAGEQFALGGGVRPWGSSFGVWPRAPWLERAGVHGLAERAAAGDSGGAASVELWSRRLPGHDLRVGGFVDAGRISRHTATGSASTSASSVGVVSHYQSRGELSFAASLAHVLRGAGADHSERFDLTIFVRY